ncbi:MAG: hypothetical protein R3C45_00005, partial [Phycisphaerales bacterium]
FRQMPELIRQGRIYIAQPPLYQVIRGKKSEYVLNEKRMRTLLSSLGTGDAALVVFNDDRTEQARLEGEQLAQAIDLLEHIQELIGIVERRGLSFKQLLAERANDPEKRARLPRIHLLIPGSNGVSGDHFFWNEQQEDDFRKQHGLSETDPDMDKVIGETQDDAPRAMRKELHEVKELERLFKRLEELGLSINDYSLKQTESVTGVQGPTRFELHATDSKGEPIIEPVVNLNDVVAAVLAHGKRGMDIKRFKGLGEMDAEQLWETTMNPADRVLLRVTWDAASEAEQLFSVLMGEEVEPRRKYIEDHALDVKNLDV